MFFFFQFEYDDVGEFVEDVKFNVVFMNDGGQFNFINEEFELMVVIVWVVLFLLVLRKGDDEGRGDDEIVVIFVQVLVVRLVYVLFVMFMQSIRGKNVRLLILISDVGGGVSVGGWSLKQERGVMGLLLQLGLRGQGSDVSMGDYGGYIQGMKEGWK